MKADGSLKQQIKEANLVNGICTVWNVVQNYQPHQVLYVMAKMCQFEEQEKDRHLFKVLAKQVFKMQLNKQNQ